MSEKSSAAAVTATMVVLLVFSFQSYFSVFQRVPLSGEEFAKPLAELSSANVLDGVFQQSAEERAVQRFGFREPLTRFYNQVAFSWLDHHHPDVIRGDGGYLYERQYLDVLRHVSDQEAQAITRLADSVSVLSGRLEQLGKQLIVLLPPNKFRFDPGRQMLTFNPDTIQNALFHFIQNLADRDIQLLDAADYLQEQNVLADYPAFAATGTHWSLYGAGLCALRLSEMIRERDSSMVRLSFKRVEEAMHPRREDLDLHQLLNLMLPAPEQRLGYPEFAGHGARQPIALIISDSYYWTFLHNGAHEALFHPGSVIFYYGRSEVVGTDEKNRIGFEFPSFVGALDRSDVVLFVVNEAAIDRFGWGSMAKLNRALDSIAHGS